MEQQNSNTGQEQRSFKRIWLNPAYQIRYVTWITLSGIGLVIFNFAIFYSFTAENYSLLVDLSPMTEESKAQLYSELNRIIILLGGASLLFIVMVALMGLVFSHRTVGPLYHFKRVFEEIKKGNTQARIRLRPKDDFRDVAETFNEMMDTIQK